MRLASLLFCVSTVGFAGTWSGYLVDSRCWMSEQTNVSPDATTVNRDMNTPVSYCSANARTKKFAVVLDDWNALKFDSVGNELASGVAHRAQKGYVLEATVSGVRNKKTINVTSISGKLIKKPY